MEARIAGDCVKAYGRKSISFSSGINIGKLPATADFPDSTILEEFKYFSKTIGQQHWKPHQA